MRLPGQDKRLLLVARGGWVDGFMPTRNNLPPTQQLPTREKGQVARLD
jgi:hypothetical protein